MIISRASSTFRVTVAIFRQKKIVIALALTFINGFSCNLTQMLGMIISRAFDFHGPWLKAKVTVVNFRKKQTNKNCHLSCAYIY